jgi:hypothetical protein
MIAAGNIARSGQDKPGPKVLTTMKDFIMLSKIGKYHKRFLSNYLFQVTVPTQRYTKSKDAAMVKFTP